MSDRGETVTCYHRFTDRTGPLPNRLSGISMGTVVVVGVTCCDTVGWLLLGNNGAEE